MLLFSTFDTSPGKETLKTMTAVYWQWFQFKLFVYVIWLPLTRPLKKNKIGNQEERAVLNAGSFSRSVAGVARCVTPQRLALDAAEGDGLVPAAMAALVLVSLRDLPGRALS